MTAIIEFLQELSLKGITITQKADNLKIKGFESKLTPEVISKLKKYKKEILQILQNDSDSLNTFPLSYGQNAMWFMWKVYPQRPTYNVLSSCRISCEIDVEILKKTFQILIERHPILGSIFPQKSDQVVQKPYQNKLPEFKHIDASNLNEKELKEEVIKEHSQPFDIENKSVMRVCLFTCSPTDHILIFTVHHIAIDAWSLPLLIEEIINIYPELSRGEKPSLTPLKHSYLDYVFWQRKLLNSPRGEELWSYWQKKLAGDLPVINLPTDKKRPPIQTYNGSFYSFTISPQLSKQIKKLAQKQGATVYMVLLASFQILLYHYTAQEDILIGVPTTGRTKEEFLSLVGYFVDPVVIRGNLSRNPSFSEFLAQIRTSVLEALSYQDFPFALLVEKLKPKRDLSRSTIFQVFFNFILQNLHQYPYTQKLLFGEEIERKGLKLKPYEIPQIGGQFDLDLTIIETNSFFSGNFLYNTDLFNRETIINSKNHFLNLLTSIINNPEEKINQLNLLNNNRF